MEVTFDRRALVKAVKDAALACAKRTSLPVLQHVLITVNGEKATIFGCDIENFAVAELACSSAKGKFAAPAERLLSYLGSLSGESVSLKTTNGWLSISCGTSRARLPLGDAESFPVLPAPKVVTWFPIQADKFSAAFSSSQWVFPVARELSINATPSVRIKATEGRVDFISACAHGACRMRIEGDGSEFNEAIAERTMEIICKMFSAGPEVLVELCEGMVRVKSDNRALIFRPAKGVPDVSDGFDKMIGTERPFLISGASRGLIAAISEVVGFCDEKSPSVSVIFADNKATIESSSLSGSGSKDVDVPFVGNSAIRIKPHYFLSALKSVVEDAAKISWNDTSMMVTDGVTTHQIGLLPPPVAGVKAA